MKGTNFWNCIKYTHIWFFSAVFKHDRC